MDYHRSVLTSRGNCSRAFWYCYQTSHRTVGSNRSATTDPFPPLPSDLPMPQLTTWLLSSDSPVSPASLRQGLHNFPFFEGSSDLWIFRLDGIPLSKVIAINERMKKYCDQKKVEFIDLWGMFVGKRHLFRKDGIHLSEAGQRKFGEILNK